MLDEEVIFKHNRQAPENKTLESILNVGGIATILAGTVAGYLGARHGLDFSKFWSFIIGGGVGFGTSLGAVINIDSAINSFQSSRYERKQMALDDKAKKERVETVDFSYRDNEIECVLRKEYEAEGHIFYMNTNDGIIYNPTFSYQPSRREPLKFRFEIPLFKKSVRADWFDLTKIKWAAREANEDEDTAIENYMSEKSADTKKESTFMEVLNKIIEGYRNKLNEAERLNINLSKDNKRIYAVLEYTGENFNSRLGLFSRCASDLMNNVYQFRSKKG